MTERIEILSLKRVVTPKTGKAGHVILAYFSCAVRGFVFQGCALARTPKQGLVAWPPRLEGPEGARRAVMITDNSLRHAMMLHAREAYRALGGTDAEEIGKSVPDGPTPPDSEGLHRAMGA